MLIVHFLFLEASEGHDGMAIDMALRCAIVDEDKPSVFGKRHGAPERHDAAAASTGAIYADEARHSLVSLPVNFGTFRSEERRVGNGVGTTLRVRGVPPK